MFSRFAACLRPWPDRGARGAGRARHIAACIAVASLTLPAGCMIGPRFSRPQAPAAQRYIQGPLGPTSRTAGVVGGEAICPGSGGGCSSPRRLMR